MRVLNFGGGTNSTALAIECVRRGIDVDVVVFADTGSEFPHTYRFVEVFSDWLQAHGAPGVTVVRWIRVRGEHAGEFIALHEDCLMRKTAPSRLFGFSGCTVKWKQQPIDNWLRSHPDIRVEHALGRPVERLIGYDADEPERAARMLAKSPNPHLWTWFAPLVDWNMGREECVQVIRDAGLSQPGKSSCWLCPSLKKHEVRELGRVYPELASQALRIEAQAELRRKKGLGGAFSWASILMGQRCSAPDPEDIPCGCYDGGD